MRFAPRPARGWPRTTRGAHGPVRLSGGDERRIDWATPLMYLALVVGGFFMVMPFIYMLSTSLKPANQVFLYPPRWIPEPKSDRARS